MTGPAKLAPVALLAITVLLGACEAAGPAEVPPSPELIIPAGVASNQTADQVVQRTLAEIAENEQRLGRRLADPRIVRVQLLRASEDYSMRRLDGTGDFGELSPGGGPGWMVEVIGTFLARDPDGRALGWGAHGFYLCGKTRATALTASYRVTASNHPSEMTRWKAAVRER